MDDKYRPGYNEDSLLFSAKEKAVTKHIKELLNFIDKTYIDKSLTYADIGNPNPKMNMLKKVTGIDVDQIAVSDFNFDSLPKKKKYDVVFCFEVLEHLQNPLFLMRELKSILKDSGTIFLTMPSNPYFLCHDYHYNEIRKKKFVKWILNPLDLVLTKYKKRNFVNDWRAIFLGVRPIIRGIRNRDFRPTLWALMQIGNYYEIKKLRQNDN